MLVDRAGAIEAQSGGFRIANAYPAGGAGEGNVYIDAGDANLRNNGIVASIALENQYSLKGVAWSGARRRDDGARINGRNTGRGRSTPEFAGEISATRCNVDGVVACAPLDTTANGGDGVTTNRDRYFVVSPPPEHWRLDRERQRRPRAGDNTRKRFY